MREILRREAFQDGSTAEHVTCQKCGKIITLWFNGGELDRQECCGMTYRLESPIVYLVVEKP